MTSFDWLTGEVANLYQRNRVAGTAVWNGLDYDFVCPSHVTYPFQWFWDSCFHAIALSHIDIARARSEIRGLLACQQPNGFIPHVIFWQRDELEDDVAARYSIAFLTRWLSDQMQPPLLAEAVDAVARRGGGDEFLAEVVPALCRYYEWCHRVRDPDQDGLIAVLQADETGLDHSPKFDEYLGIETEVHDDFTAAWHRVADPYAEVGREPGAMFALDRFIVEDVMVNTIYAENQSVLADLCERIGDDEGARRYQHRADRTHTALLEKCWDPERALFFDLAGLAEQPLRTNTITSLFPLVLSSTPSDVVKQLYGHLTDPDQYATRYPVPSVARNEPSYRPGFVGRSLVWRGPTWVNTNWYLVRGLRRHGYEELADQIVERSVELVATQGFREYYNPESGEGNGAPDFGWSAIVLDMVAG